MKKGLMLLLLCVGLLQNVSAAEEATPASGEKSLPARIGDDVKKGGEAAGRGIQKGGEAAIHGIKKAGAWVGKKMQKGGDKLEKTSEAK